MNQSAPLDDAIEIVEYSKVPTKATASDLEASTPTAAAGLMTHLSSDATPLEIRVHEFSQRRCTLWNVGKFFFWTIFVVGVVGYLYLDRAYNDEGSALQLADERSIAHLSHEMQDLQRNQRMLMEAMFQLAQQHEPSRQEKIAALMRDSIDRTNCALDPQNPLCDSALTEEMLAHLEQRSAQLKSHEQAVESQ